jgi:hypothetical protein
LLGTVNVVGIEAVCKMYLMGDGKLHALLLSRKWMYRVAAEEDHETGELRIKGKPGVEKIVSEIPAPSTHVELLPAESMNEQEAALAEADIQALMERLDRIDYTRDA